MNIAVKTRIAFKYLKYDCSNSLEEIKFHLFKGCGKRFEYKQEYDRFFIYKAN